MKKLLTFVAAVVICELVGILGTPFTVSSISTWYKFLNKPFFSPPNWVFGPVWTLLYALMGIAVAMIWLQGMKKKKVRTAVIYFVSQLLFNFLWSIVFFGLHAPFAAFVNIIVLWLAIILTIMKFYPLSKLAAYLLVPYLLWVSFASVLNASIWLLNR